MAEPKLIRKHRGATALKICGVGVGFVGMYSFFLVTKTPDLLLDAPLLVQGLALLSGIFFCPLGMIFEG